MHALHTRRILPWVSVGLPEIQCPNKNIQVYGHKKYRQPTLLLEILYSRVLLEIKFGIVTNLLISRH